METVIRVALIYLFLLAALRVMGKREFGQLAPIEFIALLLIPEILSQALIGDDFSLTNALVGITTLLTVLFLNSLLTHASEGFERVLESSPTVLAFDGRLAAENMHRERVTPDELYSEIRRAGLERLEQVRWAVLEGDGKVSIVPKEPSGALTAPERVGPA